MTHLFAMCHQQLYSQVQQPHRMSHDQWLCEVVHFHEPLDELEGIWVNFPQEFHPQTLVPLTKGPQLRSGFHASMLVVLMAIALVVSTC